MPHFVKNGPNVPERLLEKHEDGEVVFFCGAGISYPAGLPGFKGLVEGLYKEARFTPNAIQKAAIKNGNFDTAISLLEKEYIDGRDGVREIIADLLTPDLTRKNALVNHQSLLRLSKTKEEKYRLVTTNFDRIFEIVKEKNDLDYKTYQAPLLPIPKNRWEGVVYLHGLLSEKPDTEELNNLVVSSGDFGLAYLHERWAARFISELLKRYTICFIGYSLNDPVLRYMMDAIAVENTLGEDIPEMFAFGNYPKGKFEVVKKEWEAKNVTPILYKNHHRHYYLRKTLETWSDTYRDGLNGKKNLIAKHTTSAPVSNSKFEYPVGRVLWALKDRSATRFFANLTPAPPLEWIKALSNEQYGVEDLTLFGVIPDSKKKLKSKFSFLLRPAPYDLAPQMSIRREYQTYSRWDEVMHWIGVWLTRHLNNPELIYWILRTGNGLNDSFRRMIKDQLLKIEKLKENGSKEELEKIQTASKDAIPSAVMLKVWGLVLSGKIKITTFQEVDSFSSLIEEIDVFGLQFYVKKRLLKSLEPLLTIRRPYSYYWPGNEQGNSGEQSIRDIIDFEIVLAAEHSQILLESIKEKEILGTKINELINDFYLLLLDAMNLLKEVQLANAQSDSSYIHLPSISPHRQNRNYKDWTILIELNREAWDTVKDSNPKNAKNIAEKWLYTPYPVFKRLAFYAATHTEVIDTKTSVKWLTIDNNWWIWTEECRREVSRLLVAIADELSSGELKIIEDAILQGPPRKLYKVDLKDEEYQRFKERGIWLRLSKIKQKRRALGIEASKKLHELSQKYPQWKLTDDDRDEFPFWMETGSNVDIVPEGQVERAPDELKLLIKWLENNSQKRPGINEGWTDICKNKPELAINALASLSNQMEVYASRWIDLFDCIGKDDYEQNWNKIAPIIAKASKEFFSKVANPLASWLKYYKQFDLEAENQFLKICGKILEVEGRGAIDNHDDPFLVSINHPVGKVTEVLLRYWIDGNDEIRSERFRKISKLLNHVVGGDEKELKLGIPILASFSNSLIINENDWAVKNLIPKFNWKNAPVVAKAVWSGYLMTAQPFRPMLILIKDEFIQTARHYRELSDQKSNYINLIVTIGLDPRDTFTLKEISKCVELLPKEALKNIVFRIKNVVEATQENREEFWENRLKRFIKSVWPKNKDLKTKELADSVARLCLKSGSLFPKVFNSMKNWLQPLEHVEGLLFVAEQDNIAEYYPEEYLLLLDLIIDDNTIVYSKYLCMELNKINEKNSNLADTPEFKKLFKIGNCV